MAVVYNLPRDAQKEMTGIYNEEKRKWKKGQRV